MTTITHDRAAYMRGDVDHQTYYEQFATPAIIAIVLGSVNIEQLRASTDPYLNDIPLAKWDAMAFQPADAWRLVADSNASTEREHRPSISLSDKVCVLKAAARKIITDN